MSNDKHPPDKPASIVIVDDEDVVLRSLSSLLSLETDYEIHTFVSPFAALDVFKDIHVDLVISDFLMPEMNGLELLAAIKRRYPDVVRVLLTGYADRENAIRAINEVGLFQYLEKPWDNDQLILLIKNGLNQRRLERTLIDKVGELDRALRETDRLAQQQEQFREEMMLARRIQENLLPECFPDVAGLNFSAKYLPAQEVGGDYYDVIPLADGVLAAIIADVTGHGIQAALSTTMLKSLFTDFVNTPVGPEDILRRMNDVLHRVLPTDVFVAASVAEIEARTGIVRVTNGGGLHPFIIRRREKTVEPVITNGLLLGVVDSELFHPGEEVTVDLAPGDSMFFYTDGLSEAEDGNGDQFGETRLRRKILESSNLPSPELNDFIVEDLRAFAVADHKWDDITILSVERSS
ncbi:MAG: SpoIIE family protein phosphatase [Candidatus Krumholzibacteria bacterium]|nr:SpoIIE family protein phosphatase [Candidatus Krumholzibacteria bacterium]MCK5619833.1 SpoIIE family protein phosphatase [Candidatus Krumholzibacteria bacterium]